MTKPKPKNWEKVHNQPGTIYLEPGKYMPGFEGIRIYADKKGKYPLVSKEVALTDYIFDITIQFMQDNNIPRQVSNDIIEWSRIIYFDYHPLLIQHNDIPRQTCDGTSEWLRIIYHIKQLLVLSDNDNTKLYKMYKDTEVAKYTKAIESIDNAINAIWNDKTRLPEIWGYLQKQREKYETELDKFKKQRVSKNKLLYMAFEQLIKKLQGMNFTDYKIEKAIDSLYEQFQVNDIDFPGKVILRYYRDSNDP